MSNLSGSNYRCLAGDQLIPAGGIRKLSLPPSQIATVIRPPGYRALAAAVRGFPGPHSLVTGRFAEQLNRWYVGGLAILMMVLLTAALGITAAIGPARSPLYDHAVSGNGDVQANADNYVEALARLGIANVPDYSGPLVSVRN
jgi:hypothetical protein